MREIMLVKNAADVVKLVTNTLAAACRRTPSIIWIICCSLTFMMRTRSVFLIRSKCSSSSPSCGDGQSPSVFAISRRRITVAV